MLSIPRNSKGNYAWNSLPDGRCYIEWCSHARAAGPAVGDCRSPGLARPESFLVNGLAFSVVVIVLYRWLEAPGKCELPAWRFSGAVRAGRPYRLDPPAG
jgi:hypothetical protein